MSDNTFSIIEQTSQGNQVIANVDSISAPELIYPEAIYLHAGETFHVRQLDLEGKTAFVDRVDSDYYTQAILESKIVADKKLSEQAHPYGTAGLSEVDVTWKTIAFKKIKFHTHENIGFGPVDIPEQTLSTVAVWLFLDASMKLHLKQHGHRPSEALSGVRNLMVSSLPLLTMCDARDISGSIDSTNFGTSTLFVYDRYPQGLGYVERGYYRWEDLLRLCFEMVHQCPCEDGCPSCVGLPNLRPAIHSDPDLTRGYPIPDKRATDFLLATLVEGDLEQPTPPVEPVTPLSHDAFAGDPDPLP